MKKIVFVFAFLLAVSFQINAQWEQQQALPIGYNGYDICMIDDLTIVLVGDNIYKSTDGGLTWSNKLNIAYPISLVSVCFVDYYFGWTCSIEGKLFKTTDGGETWFEQNTIASILTTSVFFINHNYGWITSDLGIVMTTNGGDSWQISDLGYSSTCIFVNQNLGWAGKRMVGGSSIIKTTNAGISWEEKHSSTNYSIDALFFISEYT